MKLCVAKEVTASLVLARLRFNLGETWFRFKKKSGHMIERIKGRLFVVVEQIPSLSVQGFKAAIKRFC